LEWPNFEKHAGFAAFYEERSTAFFEKELGTTHRTCRDAGDIPRSSPERKLGCRQIEATTVIGIAAGLVQLANLRRTILV
jgi:hypothetical protein